MNRFALVFLAAAATAIALAACGSNNPAPLPTPGPTCSPPAGSQNALVYPAPGATAIPDAFGQVIIGSTVALPASWNVVVVTAISPNGVGGGTFQSAAQPFPTPNATPSFANPVYQSSSFSNRTFPGEVVTVFLNDTSTNCTPLGPLGSFTTQ
jgi:hypothetical protein